MKKFKINQNDVGPGNPEQYFTEEGRWTPEYIDVATILTGQPIDVDQWSFASYYRIGNMVYFQCETYFNSKGVTLSGNIYIRGLPYRVANVGEYCDWPCMVSSSIVIPNAGTNFYVTASGASALPVLSPWFGGTTNRNVTAADIANDFYLDVSGFYKTDFGIPGPPTP